MISVNEFIASELKNGRLIPLERLERKIEDELAYAGYLEQELYEKQLRQDLACVRAGNLKAIGSYISLDEAKGITLLKLDSWERYCQISRSTNRRRYEK